VTGARHDRLTGSLGRIDASRRLAHVSGGAWGPAGIVRETTPIAAVSTNRLTTCQRGRRFLQPSS
jgi:hypothetical protein